MTVAHASAPTDSQVKQALYDRYATIQGAADLQRALRNEVVVGACEKVDQDYRCQIENTALNTSIFMVFARQAHQNRWVFVREEP